MNDSYDYRDTGSLLSLQAQKALQRSEERFRRITEELTDYLYTVTVSQGQAEKTEHSPSCVAVTGYTAQEFASDPYLWIKMVLPEDQDDVREQARQALNGDQAPSLEHRIVRKDGKIRWVMNTIVQNFDDQGHVLSYDGLIKDITERKEMEDALRKSEARVRHKLLTLVSPEGDIGDLDLEDIVDVPALQHLMDDFYNLTNIGSAILNIKGKILVATGWQDICTLFHRVHPETCKNCLESDIFLAGPGVPGKFKLYKCKNNMWDISTPIIIGRKHLGNLYLGQFLFAGEEPDVEIFKAQALKYGFDQEEYLQALNRVPRFSRETVQLAMTFYTRLANLVSDLSFGHVKLARAISEKTKAENELKKVNCRLERTLNEKDKFFSIIAHDLKSPFIGFLNFIRLLDKHIDSMSHEDIRNLAREMKSNADNLYNLLNNLLEWSRVQRGLIEFEPAPLTLSEIADFSLELIKPRLVQKEIALHVAIPDDISILADKSMVSTVVRNILANAVKYTRRKGEINFKAEKQNKMIKIVVEDNGLGMDEKTIARLFSQGGKFSTRGTEGERGTGLGLMLCKEFVEKHGGKLWVESKPGQGATFYFTLPEMHDSVDE
ncbi:PocR ligand-binding domain-containing protein [Desulfonatronovibrio magnus]|uniref:PocR ligand-binding domain-containing protein n=1 Tax=Desulfonatronovibrio magnus TaxID=698827 RepID=UPI000697C3D9|nr:PocR ligand-binding domain-containing protein [Desulfonatronovibrio magnus]RQD55680.1 MAG: PAS domain S-box protein [Desulfonatronovibrio sp. MSAO_Bac4]